MSYLRSFVIGSSLLVFGMHLLLLSRKDPKTYGYDYRIYSIVAPLFFGVMSMLALYLRRNHGMSLRTSLMAVSVFAYAFVVWLVRNLRVYPHDREEWLRYLGMQAVLYALVYNVILYGLERNLR